MPRIVAGTARGRVIKTPSGDIRPATARARKVLFDYLAGFVQGARVLDLYSGSGGLGIEALSRGAQSVWFVDSSARALQVVRENLKMLGFEGRARLAQRDVMAFLHHFSDYHTEPFDLVFAAPPYHLADPQRILTESAGSGTLNAGAAVCLEYSRHTPPPEVAGFRLDRRRVLGETVLEVWDWVG